ncbi:MAG TPA: hypothetical protein VF883_04870 [Thermoanaerobaculia bacterium]
MDPNRGMFGYEGEGFDRDAETDFSRRAERGWNIGTNEDREHEERPTADDVGTGDEDDARPLR